VSQAMLIAIQDSQAMWAIYTGQSQALQKDGQAITVGNLSQDSQAQAVIQDSQAMCREIYTGQSSTIEARTSHVGNLYRTVKHRQ
jgi:hypothetical protein